jgi:hypothetical protein
VIIIDCDYFGVLKTAGIACHRPALQQGLTADQKDTRLRLAQRYLNFDWFDFYGRKSLQR